MTVGESGHHGLIARFDSGDKLLAATRRLREAGHHRLDAHAPFPVPGLAEVLEYREYGIPRIALLAATITAGIAFLMQWYSAVIDYPIVVGGKPLNSWPAFLPVTFKVGIFNAVMATAITMLVKNRLPRFHHPLFDEKEFSEASTDGFFLVVHSDEPGAAEELLQRCGARSVRELQP